jgi:hypothetical protein
MDTKTIYLPKPQKYRACHSRQKSYSLRLQFALWLIANKNNHFTAKSVEEKLIELKIDRAIKTICFQHNIFKRVDDYFITVNNEILNKYTPSELCDYLIGISRAYENKRKLKAKEKKAKLMLIEKSNIVSQPVAKNENLQIVLDTLNAIHTKLDNISKAIGLNAKA